MAPNNLPQREEYLRKKRKKRLQRYGIFLMLSILFIVLFSYAAHRKEFRISTIELEGGILVTHEDVEVKSLEYLQGSYFWLFPKDNSFWYPNSKLEDYLRENFKRIDTIKVNLKGLRTLHITITERKPFAIWCNGLPENEEVRPNESEELLSSPERTCYFIDQNSTIFAPAPDFSGDAYFKYYSVSTTSPIGKEFMASTTQFVKIADFVAQTKAIGVRPLYIVAKEDGEFSLVVSGGGEIYFDLKEPLSKVAENLGALLRTPEMTKTADGNLPIEYIDLRYGNKLFYKLKGE